MAKWCTCDVEVCEMHTPKKAPAKPAELVMEDFLNLHARKILSAPVVWEWRKAEIVGDNEPKIMQVTGAVFERKRGGGPNYRKPLPGTLRTVCFSTVEHEAFIAGWEHSTGKCAKCSGHGQMAVGWSKESGVRYAPCSKCDATGKVKG